MMKWQLKELSDSWKQCVTGDLRVEEWFCESAKLRRLDLGKIMLVKKIKLSSQFRSALKSKVFNQSNTLAVGF